MKLTHEESLVLIDISEFMRKKKRSPKIRDISHDLKKSPSTIHYHLRHLVNKGFIHYNENGDLKINCLTNI